jgi:hypothetical protein
MKATKKVKYCYKVVCQKDDGKMTSYSLGILNPYCIFYKINKISKKVPDTWGIWVFRNKKFAIQFAEIAIGRYIHKVLLCEYEGKIEKKIPLQPMCLSSSYLFDILKLSDEQIKCYQTNSEFLKGKSYVVDLLKPVKIVYKTKRNFPKIKYRSKK